jgi:hypothetical protein
MKIYYGAPELLSGYSLGAAVKAPAARLPGVKEVATVGTSYQVDHV